MIGPPGSLEDLLPRPSHLHRDIGTGRDLGLDEGLAHHDSQFPSEWMRPDGAFSDAVFERQSPSDRKLLLGAAPEPALESGHSGRVSYARVSAKSYCRQEARSDPLGLRLFFLPLNQLLLLLWKFRDFTRDSIVVLALDRVVGDVERMSAVVAEKSLEIIGWDTNGADVEGAALWTRTTDFHDEASESRGNLKSSTRAISGQYGETLNEDLREIWPRR